MGVCAAFVYLSMTMSAMWYNVAPEKPSADSYFDLGAFSLSAEQVFVIGVIFLCVWCLYLHVDMGLFVCLFFYR